MRTGKGYFKASGRLRTALLTSSALALAWALPAAPAHAASDGTWLTSPGSNDYGTGSNWDGNFVPAGTASFGTSATTSLVISSASVGDWTFNAGASNYTFDVSGPLNFTGAGIIVNGGSATIYNNNQLVFFSSSTAGNAAITNNSVLGFADTASAGNATILNINLLSFTGASTAGAATIANNFSAAFSGSSTAGNATITNSASGILSFLSSSSAGSAAITNDYVLYFQNDSTAGSADITNNGGIAFSGFATAGNATITNNGGLTFANRSTAGNAAIINNVNGSVDFGSTSGINGDNKISAGSIAGAGFYQLGAIELTVGSNNLSTEVSGVIAGIGGSLVKTGTGKLILSGVNTYTGGTTFAGGTVSVSSDANLGDAAAGLTFNGGTLQVAGTAFNTTARTVNLGAGGGTFDIADAANDFVISQSISGGALTKSGAGTLTLTGAAGFSGATVSAGALVFDGNATAGNAAITNNAELVFASSATAGNATITNSNQLTFYGNTTAGNAVISSSGNVLFDGNSTAGNAQLINIVSSAVINFFTPGPGSDGKISAGSIAGNGRFDLNGAELTVGSNNLSTIVTGVLTGDGSITGTSLIKVGTGTLTLAGINTYSGATIVDGGTLAVNGSIASSSNLTVNSGGTLGGTGVVGNTTIASGGTLAPGNSVGTLTVSGNLGFTAGSFYRVEVSASAADRTNVSGTATLTGATVQAVVIPSSFRGQTFTLLNATGGLGGTQFAGLTIAGSFSPARNPRLTYDPNNVFLVLDPGKIELPAGTSGNQTSVAGGINNAVESGATPPAGFDVLLNMSGAQLDRALSQVSGQPGAAGTQAAFNAMQQFLGMLDPVGGSMDSERGMNGSTLGYANTAQGDARVREAYAAVTPREASGDVIDRRWGVWASGYGGGSTLSGNAAEGSRSTASRIYGTVVGADYRVSPDTLVGFALGGAGFNFSVADALGGGRAGVFQAGLYARHNFGPSYLSAALAYGWQDVTTDRTVTVSGTDRLTANFKASTFAGRLEAGWHFVPFPASSFGVTPYAAVQATTFHLPGYGETALVGSNQFALSYGAQDTTNVRTELGGRTDQRFLVNDGVLTLRGRLAWAHDTNTNWFVNAAFQTLPGAAFTVSGARPAADSALVGGRAEMKWRIGLSLAGTVEGEFSRNVQTYTGKGTVRYEW
ncbi:autotransporter domain-containing protein [Bradyrhizobium sp. A11]|uniref:autotransporter domain-containing protein n=1 Tax=Bradyrhizobium sp. A11 TaxID=3133974 RepID=UPI00324CA19A